MSVIQKVNVKEVEKLKLILETMGCFPEDFFEFLNWAIEHWNQVGGTYKTPCGNERVVAIREASPWFTRKEAAAYLGFEDPKSIDRLRERGQLSAYYPGEVNCPRFFRDDLDGLMGREK